MSALDLSALTDDQLVELGRACCEEAVRRHPAMREAMHNMMLSEAERMKVAQAASEAEAAAARARERIRISQEAIAKVRAEEASRTEAERARQAQNAAMRARQAAERIQHRDMALLRHAADLSGYAPCQLTFVHCHTRRGQRIFVNLGADRFSREHLAEYDVRSSTIKTTASLVKSKPDLIALCANLAAVLPLDTHICGQDYAWPTEEQP